MVVVLMIMVFTVVALGWFLAAIAFVALLASLRPPEDLSATDLDPHPDGSRDADAQFLHDVGIRT